MEVRELTCIGCPMGCALTVTLENGEVTSVSGNTCKIGENYGREEVLNPRRTITSTMKVVGGEAEVVSVKTKEAIPKGRMMECMAAINETQVKAPVSIGDVLISDVAGTKIAVVATKNVEAKE